MPLTEQQESVELLVETAAGLMDSGGNGTASRCQVAEELEEMHGCSAVEAASWFVQEYQGRINEQLYWSSNRGW